MANLLEMVVALQNEGHGEKLEESIYSSWIATNASSTIKRNMIQRDKLWKKQRRVMKMSSKSWNSA
jgi:hypothetical protein